VWLRCTGKPMRPGGSAVAESWSPRHGYAGGDPCFVDDRRQRQARGHRGFSAGGLAAGHRGPRNNLVAPFA
jgi:hypothetical protein